MHGINRVFLMGYLGAAPELQTSKGGKPYAKINLATHYTKKLDSGERQATTVWHKVQVWGRNAERCHTYLDKGSPLALEGYLTKYNYEKEDGTPGTGILVVAREVHFIGRPRPKEKEPEAGTTGMFAPNS